MAARPERLGEIRWVDHLSRNHQECIAVAEIEAIEILGDHGVAAIRDAVLAKVPRLHLRRDDFQRAAARSARTEEAEWSASAHHAVAAIPRRDRRALPITGARTALTEGEEARLCTGIGLDLDRAIVLPSDAQPSRQSHD